MIMRASFALLALLVRADPMTHVDMSQTDYSVMLDGLFDQCALDGTGELSLTEFITAADKLGIEETVFVNHQQSYEVVFNALDTDDSGGLTPDELAAAVADRATHSALPHTSRAPSLGVH